MSLIFLKNNQGLFETNNFDVRSHFVRTSLPAHVRLRTSSCSSELALRLESDHFALLSFKKLQKTL